MRGQNATRGGFQTRQEEMNRGAGCGFEVSDLTLQTGDDAHAECRTRDAQRGSENVRRGGFHLDGRASNPVE